MMKYLLSATLLALFLGCKAGGADLQDSMKTEACAEACERAKVECVTKCSEEVDPDACALACDAAKDKCISECSEKR